MKRNTSTVANNKDGTTFESKKYAYNNNYKDPMTRTQRRRRQKSRKDNTKNLNGWTPDAEPIVGELCSLTLGNDENGHPI